MKLIGSTSTESFIPEENLYFGIIFARELCSFMDFKPLIKNLILNFLFNLNNGAFTGPNIFLDKELDLRKKNNLPPFQRFISLILTGNNEAKLEKEAFKFKTFIENKLTGKILGPVNAPIFRLKRKFRIRFLIRGLKSMKLQSSLTKIIPKYKFSSGIKLSVDVDPINFN